MKALVIHATKLKERGENIDSMLRAIGLDYDFISEGDADQLTDELIDKYLTDGPEDLHRKSSRASCTIKHFLAYEKIVAENMEGALVLEDDIVLHKNFMSQFEKSIVEYRNHYTDRKVIISYEDSSLQFVPRSQRKKGRMLYHAEKGRMAGAYYINRFAAESILERLKTDKCDLPIDLYHYKLFQEHFLESLWCQPALATQGSFTGQFRSSLSKKKDIMIAKRWWLKKKYKRMLYWLR